MDVLPGLQEVGHAAVVLYDAHCLHCSLYLRKLSSMVLRMLVIWDWRLEIRSEFEEAGVGGVGGQRKGAAAFLHLDF